MPYDQHWSLGSIRTKFEYAYNRDYRYNPMNKKPLIELVYDISDDDSLAIMDINNLENESAEWARKCMVGDVSQKTGIRIFNTPRPDRMSDIVQHLKDNGFLFPIDWLKHGGNIVAAQRTTRRYGFDKYASPDILGSRIFGNFISTQTRSDQAELILLKFYHQKGEPCIRVRRQTLEFSRYPEETMESFATRIIELEFNKASISDEFANLGATYGAIFQPLSNAQPSCIDNYDWNNKGHRILRFSETQSEGCARDFLLVQRADEINAALDIDRVISRIIPTPLPMEPGKYHSVIAHHRNTAHS